MHWRKGANPMHVRQGSGGSSSAGSASPFLVASGVGGMPTVRRTQNVAAKAAAARLAQVMASQNADDDDEGDEEDGHLAAAAGFWIGSVARLTGTTNGGSVGSSVLGKGNRSASPASSRNSAEHCSTVCSTSAGRPSLSTQSIPHVPPTVVPPSLVHQVITLKAPPTIPPTDLPTNKHTRKRFQADIGHMNSKENGITREASELQDELDMLQEDNENMLEKLRLAEEKRDEADARTRELEKQVSLRY